MKFKGKPYEFETQNLKKEDEADIVIESSQKKRKRVQSLTKKNMVSKRPISFKSKGKQVSSCNSKKSGRSKGKRTRFTDIYDNIEAKYSVMERAERVVGRLANEVPSFGKCMLPSNVAHGFWLHLPKSFCSQHLPNHDATVVLVDEWENEYETSYLLYRHGLSAGWRGFSISHRLLKGDILIFELIEPCKLKECHQYKHDKYFHSVGVTKLPVVRKFCFHICTKIPALAYQVQIVRVNERDVVEAALCLLNLNACRNGNLDLMKKDNKKRKKVKCVEPFLRDISTPLESSQSKGKNTEF